MSEALHSYWLLRSASPFFLSIQYLIFLFVPMEKSPPLSSFLSAPLTPGLASLTMACTLPCCSHGYLFLAPEAVCLRALCAVSFHLLPLTCNSFSLATHCPLKTEESVSLPLIVSGFYCIAIFFMDTFLKLLSY